MRTTSQFLQEIEHLCLVEISKECLENVGVSTWLDNVTQSLCVEFSQKIWGEHKTRQMAQHPATWLDALKLRWFPKWILVRFPAKHTTVVADFYVLYPDFKPSVAAGRYRIDSRIGLVQEEDGGGEAD